MEYYFISQNLDKIKGKYLAENNLGSAERLLYFAGKPIETPIVCKITYNGLLPDYIDDGLLILVSDRIQKVVVSKDVVFYPASVTHVVNKKERVYTNYYLMSPPLKSALNLELSEYEWIVEEELLGDITKAVVNENILESYPLVRLEENNGLILCNADIYTALSSFQDAIVFENSSTFKSGLI